MREILVVLKKDIKEYWIMPLILILIPLIVFYFPINSKGKEMVVGVYGEITTEVPFTIKIISSIDEGIKQVKKGELDGLYLAEQKTLYGNRKEKAKCELLLYLLSEPTNMIKEISIENSL